MVAVGLEDLEDLEDVEAWVRKRMTKFTKLKATSHQFRRTVGFIWLILWRSSYSQVRGLVCSRRVCAEDEKARLQNG